MIAKNKNIVLYLIGHVIQLTWGRLFCELRACELRVASCELRVASCELRVASCELRVASCEDNMFTFT